MDIYLLYRKRLKKAYMSQAVETSLFVTFVTFAKFNSCTQWDYRAPASSVLGLYWVVLLKFGLYWVVLLIFGLFWVVLLIFGLSWVVLLIFGLYWVVFTELKDDRIEKYGSFLVMNSLLD